MKIVVLGTGDVGTFLASQLSTAGHEVVVVDHSSSAIANVEERSDVLAVCGDCTHRSILRTAKVDHADLVLAMTGSDQCNLIGAALATDQGARRSLARVDDPKFYAAASGVERGVLGIHSLLCASRLVSEELLRQVAGTGTAFLGSYCNDSVHLASLPVTPDSVLLGQAAHQIGTATRTRVVAVLRDALLRFPRDIAQLEVDDQVLVSGSPQGVSSTIRELAVRAERAIIVGGGDVGVQLAHALARIEDRVDLIEYQLARCKFLAQELPDVRILHGDGADIAHLKDQHAGTADYLLAVTRKDEVNLMTSLLARELGTRRAFALVHRPGYAAAYEHLGLTATTGAHQVILRAIESQLPRQTIFAEQLPRTGYSMYEWTLSPGIASRFRLEDIPPIDGAIYAALSVDGAWQACHTDASVGPGTRVALLAPTSLRAVVAKRTAAFRGDSA